MADVPNEWFYASVDLANDVTTITTAPCLLGGYEVTTALSANACPITDAGTSVLSIPASSAVGAFRELLHPIRTSNLIVDPDNAGTGVVTILYRILGRP